MLFFNKYEIKFNTFLKRGVKFCETPWLVAMVTGYQGSGKTYYAVSLTQDLLKLNYKIYTNIKSLYFDNVDINYFTKIKDIVNNYEENCIFIIDEISKKYPKNAPIDKEFYSWLQQSRKRGRIVILITQEWKEVPTWLRRPVKFLYTTRKLPFLPFFITSVGDGLNLTFNVETNEWECPIIKYIFYKRIKKVADCYDTFEPIEDL